MSDTDQILSKGVFDLRQVLSERQLPEDTVEFYVDEDLGYKIEKIEKHLESLHNQLQVAGLGDNEELKLKAEKAVAEAEDLLIKTRQAVTPYKATIRAITRRARHDLQSKSLHAYPIKRDFIGNDDSENEFNRNHYITQLIWASHLRSIESPDGTVQTFSGMDDFDTVAEIMDSLPTSAYRAIDKAIDRITDTGAQFEWVAKSEDFS